MNEQEFAELAAGYALNALSPQDRWAFEAERARHPEWEHWISADAATAAALAEGVADAAPPLTMRSSLLSRIATTPQRPAMDASAAAAAFEPGEPFRAAPEPVSEAEPEPASGPETGAAANNPNAEPPPNTSAIQAISRRNWSRGLLALAACLVVLTVLGFGAASINELVNRPPAVVALDEIESAPDATSATVEVTGGGTATAHWAPSVGKVVLVANGMPEIPDDETFELWWVRAGDPISAGTFEAGADGDTTVLLDGEWSEEDVVAVTVEPEGGAPDGVPTTEPIVAIPTA
ncbi:anti-sigma factor [Microbacterium sp. HD4P20]|uniref:anti-sigma factor n=1 Tax=Microbacterium sp. HD4P20 TaxID=2864874 RepID=UPI001C6444A6|nr:anti-sigma factor [Microbacterium sp. HD4P20]MCP2637558.1 anti-sigma factor [Microbacterium sp. HD4P20]